MWRGRMVSQTDAAGVPYDVFKPRVIEKLATRDPAISTFEEMCLLRSYDIEAVI